MTQVVTKDITSYTDYLPNQYDNSTKLRTLLSIFLAQVQELEDANMELDRVSTNVELAYGYQLDIIGKLIGVARKGQTDTQYRDSIYFQISVNVGNGTPEDAIQYLAYVTNATEVRYWEHYPASVILETNGTNVPSNIPNTLDNITMAGVSVGGVIISESGEVFRGCDTTVAYENFEDITSPYPEIELGGMDQECGNPLAECSYIGFTGFTEVSDSSSLARCIFPEISEVYTVFANGAGEDIMACGEDEAQCASEFDQPLTTKGILADIYTKI